MKTVEELSEFINQANRYLVIRKDERSQVTHALQKLTKKHSKALERVFEDLRDTIEDLRVDHCEKDDKGVMLEEKIILKNASGEESAQFIKKFKPENEKKLRKEVREATRGVMDKPAEFEPHYCELPTDFDEFYRAKFEGFIFKETTN